MLSYAFRATYLSSNLFNDYYLSSNLFNEYTVTNRTITRWRKGKDNVMPQ